MVSRPPTGPAAGPPSDDSPRSVTDPRSATRTSSRPPPARQDPAQEESIRALRKVAASLDALVRGASTGTANAIAIAERTLAGWLELGGTKLEVTPLGLFVQGVLVLEAKAEQGRWLLPAFMSGVRTLRISAELKPVGLVTMAQNLGVLKSDEQSIDAFQSWLWAEGVPGIELETMPSFVEQMEATQTKTSGAIEIFQTAQESAVAMDAGEFDSAAEQESFNVPLERFSSRFARRELELGGELFGELRFAPDHAGGWFSRELDLFVRSERMQRLVAPSRAADRLSARTRSAYDQDMAHSLLRLMDAGVPYADALSDALVRADTFQALVDRAPPTAAAVRTLGRFLHRPGASGSQVARALMARTLREEALQKPMSELVQEIALDEFLRLLGTPLEDAHCLTIFELLRDAEDEFERIQQVLNASTSAMMVAYVVSTAAPAGYLLESGLPLVFAFKPQLERVIDETDSPTLAPLIPILTSPSFPQGESLILKWVAKHSLDTIRPAERFALLGVLTRSAEGAERLIDWVRDRKAPPTLRMAALGVLDGKTEWMTRATAFRFSEWLEPGDIAHAIKSARDKVKRS